MKHLESTMWLYKSIFYIGLVVLLGACNAPLKRAIVVPGSSQIFSQRIDQWVDTSQVLSQAMTGLVIYDMETHQEIYNRNGHKSFLPASNNKTLTLAAALKVLGDSIPALRYVETDTSLIFWGTGDPTFLNKKFKTARTYDFLRFKAASKKLFYHHQELPRYAEGWMWDDYNGGYQPELSAMPIYENMVHFRVDTGRWKVTPYPENGLITLRHLPMRDYTIRRVENLNVYDASTSIDSMQYYEQKIPIFLINNHIATLLSDTLGVKINSYIGIPPTSYKTLYSMRVDTMLAIMMKESDNFLADHTVLLCSTVMNDHFDISGTLNKWIDDKILISPHKPYIVDGSGLSRYNLHTPMTQIAILQQMVSTYGEQRIYSLMAISGQRGTLQNLFKDKASPYVFAKSGTISGVYNLSGYLHTDSGQKLIFSFMNNNYPGPSSHLRKEVERILKEIAKQYKGTNLGAP
jgi:serine-type D-Ala-D-Ala carboxypeptidase/endopeptidase (penicillin-binding protein 4)